MVVVPRDSRDAFCLMSCFGRHGRRCGVDPQAWVRRGHRWAGRRRQEHGGSSPGSAPSPSIRQHGSHVSGGGRPCPTSGDRAGRRGRAGGGGPPPFLLPPPPPPPRGGGAPPAKAPGGAPPPRGGGGAAPAPPPPPRPR